MLLLLLVTAASPSNAMDGCEASPSSTAWSGVGMPLSLCLSEPAPLFSPPFPPPPFPRTPLPLPRLPISPLLYVDPVSLPRYTVLARGDPPDAFTCDEPLKDDKAGTLRGIGDWHPFSRAASTRIRLSSLLLQGALGVLSEQ